MVNGAAVTPGGPVIMLFVDISTWIWYNTANGDGNDAK